MAIPSGSWTEVLCRGTAHALSSTATALRFDRSPVSAVGTNTVTVPANHVISLISLSFTEAGGSTTETVNLIINDGTNDIYLLKAQSVEANSTFIWNDRIVIGAGDKVSVFCDSAANVDVYYTYIDQDWT